MNNLNNNNFLRFSGEFAGSTFWTLAFSADGNSVCSEPALSDFYSAHSAGKLKEGVQLFSNSAMSAPAANGWYSNSVFKYEVAGGTIVNVLNCEG